jgi:hypothetical protein
MSDRVRVATRKGLFTITRRDRRWEIGTPEFLGDPVTNVLDDSRDGALYATLNLGHFGVKLKRSRDDGKSWEEIAAPTYPPQPEGAQGAPWKLVLIWALEAGGKNEPGVLWAGTIPGGLFRSRDHGQSWQLIESLWNDPDRLKWAGGGYDHPGIHSILVDPRDPARMAVGVSTGGVWISENAGETWRVSSKGMRATYMPPELQGDEIAQDIHRMVACPQRPETLWVQHHCGIFRSTDSAATWTEINDVPPSSFGFAVAVHPHDPDVAWFVPAIKDERRVPVDARFVVTRTRDGGKHFDVLSAGLPAEPSYDLVYRHGLAVDATGMRLAMGSTTGGLWISEDSGDAWQCVSLNLPPIAAVRFAE